VDKTSLGQGGKATKANYKEKVHLNADTTIELVKQNTGIPIKVQQVCRLSDNFFYFYKIKFKFPSFQANGVSIMDQLSRGIKVEGLTLPPGITLTRVDSQTADAIRAKKESIGRVCENFKKKH
jgi:hypothetical protein